MSYNKHDVIGLEQLYLEIRPFIRNHPNLGILLDDNMGITIVSASTLEKEMREDIKSGATCSAATRVGSLIAERAIAKGLTDVVFDRGGYLFHGRVKALADSARKSGLKF